MADYKNFFNNNSPLNLNNSKDPVSAVTLPIGVPVDPTGGIKIKPASLPKAAFETDEEYATRLQKEEEEYQEYLRRQSEYNLKLKFDEMKAFQNNLASENNDGSQAFYAKANALAKAEVLNGIDPETGKYKHGDLLIQRGLLEYADFLDVYKNVTDAGKAFKAFGDSEGDPLNEYIKQFADLVGEDLLSRGTANNKDDFMKEWNRLDSYGTKGAEKKLELIVKAIGRKYLDGNALEEFNNLDTEGKFNMLSSIIRNNPNYESLTSKHKESIDWGDNDFSKEWKAATENATNRFLYGLTGGDGWNVFLGFTDIVGGGALSAMGNLGELAGSLVGSTGEYIQSRMEGAGFEEDVDALINKSADAYITEKSKDLYANIILRIDQEKKASQATSGVAESATEQKILKEFDALSSSYSNEYNAEKGTALTELSNGEKIKLYVNAITRSELFGDLAAATGLKSFWDDTISGRQSHLDKALRTAGTFSNSAVADIAAFAGVITNPMFMAVDFHDSTNPEDWTVNGEGYTDALVKYNPILTWATNLLETGAWSTELQKKYKDLGVNALQIYKSTEDLNSFLSGNDFYDIVGLYGFTAATTALSLGGSAALKSMVKSTGKRVLNNGVRGRILRGATTAGEARQALKVGLAKGATDAELTAAKETIAKISANALYKGNLAIEAALGTAEGALEAKSTYNTFVEENMKELENTFSSYQSTIDDDSKVRDYMLSNGYIPSLLISNNDGTLTTDFSAELFKQARGELQGKLDEAKAAAVSRIEDNAADAAAVNFISNSFINGILNVFMKEAIMSRDMREASRRLLKKNKFSDLIDVVKKGDSWEAVVKKAVTDNGKRSIWKGAKDIAGKTIKNAGGEFLEEYSQNLSDTAARDALQADLNQYMATLFDKESREAFQTDWTSVVDAGLNSVKTNLTDLENLKAGVFGGLSSLIGGFNPTGIFSTVKGFAQGREAADKGAWGTTKWIARNLGNLYLGAIQQSVRDYNDEKGAALRLAETVNGWLNTAKNQELLTHMGGAIGFKKAMEDAIMVGDDFLAHDSKLSLSVENAFMLLALKDTDYGKAMQQKLRDNVELLLVAEDAQNFDENGKYVGLEEWVNSAVSSFKNQAGDASRQTNLTDLQILLRVGQNAKDFLDLLNKVIAAQRRVQSIFKDDNIDPLTIKAFAHALVQLEKARERKSSLLEKLYNATHNENLTDAEKETLKESGLDQGAIDFIIKHGSLERAEKEYLETNQKMNKLAEDANNKKLSKEKRAEARRALKALTKLNRALNREIAIEKDRRELGKVEQNLTNQEDSTITLTEEAPTIFSAGDLANMSASLQAYVISNKEIYTKEQQEEINKFIDIARRNIATLEDDLALSNEEVAKDYIDLAALETKVGTYDKFLTEFINNPNSLSTTASAYREKERTRTLRHLYKDDLKLKEGETVIDFKDRLDSKIKSLQELGKSEDASILRKLISENKEVSKVESALNDARLAIMMYGITHQLEMGNEDINVAYAALNTLIGNSGLSLLELKRLFDTSDTTTLIQYLLKTTINGQNVLNRELTKAGMKALDITDDLHHNEEVLSPVLLRIKDFLDNYYNLKKSSLEKPTTSPIVGAVNQLGTTVGRQASIPVTKPQQQLQLSIETPMLTISTPGDIDANTQLGNFLRSRGVSGNVRKVSNSGNPNINFAVVRDYGLPVVFAVQLVSASLAVVGKTLNIGGANYAIIGVMNQRDGFSTAMQQLGEEAYSKMLPDEEAKLLSTPLGNVTALFSQLGDNKYKGEQNQENAIPLKTLLNEDDLRISLWVSDLMREGRKVELPKDDDSGDTTLVLKDGYDYPVLLTPTDKEEASGDIRKFPVAGSTLLEIIEKCDFNDDLSIKDTILKLKENEFFQAFFEAWRDFQITSVTGSAGGKGDKIAYESLIGDFIFLGYPYVQAGSGGLRILSEKAEYLNPILTIEEGNAYLTIDSVNKGNALSGTPKVSFSFDIPSVGALSSFNRELLALKALKQIVDISYNHFAYSNPLIGFDIINSKDLSSTIRLREALRLTGLIKAGLLSGFAPSAVSRNMQVANPFILRSSASRSNDNNASLMDPSTKGKTEGGVVDVETGLPVLGSPKTTQQRIREGLEHSVLKALEIVARIVTTSKGITLESSNSETYLKEGIDYSRVTSVKEAYIGGEATAFDASDDDANISHAYGNTVDNVIRASLETLNAAVKEGKTLDKNQLLQEILRDDAFKTVKDGNPVAAEHVPNWSDFLIKKFLDLIIAFHSMALLMGWTIVPKDVRTFGLASVKEGGVEVGKLPIAGTLDLLVYDREGVFHIIDIKTMRMTGTPKESLANNKAGWEVQVGSYQGTLEQLNDDMVFGLNYIFPIFLPYNKPAGEPVKVADDGMTVTNYSPNGQPECLTKPKSPEDTYTVSDFLFEIDTLPFEGFDKNKLSESDLKRIIYDTNLSGVSLASKGDKSLTQTMTSTSSTVSSEASKADGSEGSSIDDLLDNMNLSKRTTREARFTEFINNHIAPVTRAKIGIVSRAVSKIKSLIDPEGKNAILKQELANTFFNGDVTKLELILRDIKVSMSNLPKIVDSLRAYYSSYLQNKDTYISNINRRYQIGIAVEDFLKGDITESLLEEILHKNNTSIDKVSELVEYLASTDKAKTALEILNKLHTSKVTTDEHYRNSLNTINSTMESMQAKLDFLNTTAAVRMLEDRVNSIQDAVAEGSVDEYVFNKSGALEDLLGKKSGNYGATKLLRDISLRTKNGHFRRLANTLLRLVRERHLVIPITVEDGSLNFIEGTTIGKSIIINKSSLDSYEHLERVLLHEILHAVVEVSPEMKSTLQNLLDLAIVLLQKETGKSKQQIQREYYGLTNVNEFISEFFTNYAFQETLKNLGSNDYKNIFDKFIGSLKQLFVKESSLYTQISKSMEDIVGTSNIESTLKRTERTKNENIGRGKFLDLSADLLRNIKARGISETEYNSMLPIVLRQLLKCCK